MAGYVIHTASGLGPAGEQRATELGPSDVTASESPEGLARQAALTVLACEDVTESFRLTCDALLRARERLADQLRAEEGDDFYEEEHRKKKSMLLGIDEGLLRRSLIVASRLD